jgi:hypothetical protein
MRPIIPSCTRNQRRLRLSETRCGRCWRALRDRSARCILTERCPKYLPQLVEQFERRGGIAHIFLTHRDDVAEAEKYAARFSSRRIIHRLELALSPALKS